MQIPDISKVSAKTRFEVFKRDGFVCQYCGAHPPDALLHADHIKPRATGGSSEMDNLITACDRCNMGKGARELSVIPLGLAEKAALIAEKEAQIRGYSEIMERRRERLDDEARVVALVFDPDAVDPPMAYLLSLRKFVDRLGLSEVVDAAEKSVVKCEAPDQRRWKYFCGICWNKIRALGDEQ